MAKQEEMAKSFEAKTGIKVEVIPIEEKDLGTRLLLQLQQEIYLM